MSVLLKNGLVVTATGSYTADVLVEGEKIKAIGTGFSSRVDETVDAVSTCSAKHKDWCCPVIHTNATSGYRYAI